MRAEPKLTKRHKVDISQLDDFKNAPSMKVFNGIVETGSVGWQHRLTAWENDFLDGCYKDALRVAIERYFDDDNKMVFYRALDKQWPKHCFLICGKVIAIITSQTSSSVLQEIHSFLYRGNHQARVERLRVHPGAVPGVDRFLCKNAANGDQEKHSDLEKLERDVCGLERDVFKNSFKLHKILLTRFGEACALDYSDDMVTNYMAESILLSELTVLTAKAQHAYLIKCEHNSPIREIDHHTSFNNMQIIFDAYIDCFYKSFLDLSADEDEAELRFKFIKISLGSIFQSEVYYKHETVRHSIARLEGVFRQLFYKPKKQIQYIESETFTVVELTCIRNHIEHIFYLGKDDDLADDEQNDEPVEQHQHTETEDDVDKDAVVMECGTRDGQEASQIVGQHEVLLHWLKDAAGTYFRLPSYPPSEDFMSDLFGRNALTKHVEKLKLQVQSHLDRRPEH